MSSTMDLYCSPTDTLIEHPLSDAYPYLATIDGHVPKGKRKKLNFEKCERCRKDKQGCEPGDGTGPAKCKRCNAKGLPCSPRKRTKRRTRSTVPYLDPPSLVSSTGVSIQPPHSSQHQHWHFLLSFHKILLFALGSLDKLFEETKALFGVRLDAKESEEQRQFRDFVQRLNSLLHETTGQLYNSGEAQSPSTLLLILAGQVLADPFPSVNPICLICNPNHGVRQLHDKIREYADVGTQFLYKLGALARHNLHYKVQWTFEISKRELAECATLINLSVDLQSTAMRTLKDTGLYELTPVTLRNCNYFIPDKLCAWNHFLLQPTAVDCLGRTGLHQYLDGLSYSARNASDSSIISAPDAVTQAVIKTNIDLNQSDILSRSVLHVASYMNNAIYVKALLKEKADASRKTSWGALPLHYAAAGGCLEACHELLRVRGFDINAVDDFGNTPLFYAVRNKRIAVFELLLASGSRISITHTNKELPCVLIEAILQQSELLVQRLLDCGADPNSVHRRKSAFCYAVQGNNAAILGRIGTQPGLIVFPESLKSLLSLTITGNYEQSFQYLTSRKDVDLNARLDNGRTHLMNAIMLNRDRMVGRMLSLPNIDIQTTDNNGNDVWNYVQNLDYPERITRLLNNKMNRLRDNDINRQYDFNC